MATVTIIEGPRAVGKTALTEALELYGFTRAKFTRGTNPTKDMVSSILAMSQTDLNYVVDRFHLTELVMRMHDRKVNTKQVLYDTEIIHGLLRQIEANVIILDAPTAVLATRVKTRADGRGFEMHPELSQVLWGFASDVFDVPTMQNVSLEDQTKIIARVIEETKIAVHFGKEVSYERQIGTKA